VKLKNKTEKSFSLELFQPHSCAIIEKYCRIALKLSKIIPKTVLKIVPKIVHETVPEIVSENVHKIALKIVQKLALHIIAHQMLMLFYMTTRQQHTTKLRSYEVALHKGVSDFRGGWGVKKSSDINYG
jgi:hypothetical protein